MKQLQLVVLLVFLSCCSEVISACAPPRYAHIALANSADLIIGVKIDQLDLTVHELPIDQVIKGEQLTHIEHRLPEEFEHLKRYDTTPVYALIFLSKYGETDYSIMFAENSVLMFDSMEELNLAITRFNALFKIQKIKEQVTRETELIEWLVQGMELAAVGNRSFYDYGGMHDITNRQTMAFDALMVLSTWAARFFDNAWWDYWMFSTSLEGEVTLVSTTQKQRIAKLFYTEKQPHLYLSHLIEALGVELKNDRLFELLYQSNQERKIISIFRYEELLYKQLLTNEEKRGLAQFILFNLKVNVPTISSTWIDSYWYYIKKSIHFVSDYLSLHEVKQLATACTEAKLLVNEQLTEFMDAAEVYLNMCNDPRINQLTGKRKLWTCANESAFATAEAFEEGSIETTIYPNPSNGNFTIKLKLEKEAVVQLTLESLEGQQIIQQELESKRFENERFYFQQELNLEGLATGIYLLTIRQHNKVFVEKIMIQ